MFVFFDRSFRNGVKRKPTSKPRGAEKKRPDKRKKSGCSRLHGESVLCICTLLRARHIAGIEQLVIRIATSILRPCKHLIDLWTKADDGAQPFQIKIIPFEDDPTSMFVMLKSLSSEIDYFISPCDSTA